MANSIPEMITTLAIQFSEFKEELSKKMDAFKLQMEVIERELNLNSQKEAVGESGETVTQVIERELNLNSQKEAVGESGETVTQGTGGNEGGLLGTPPGGKLSHEAMVIRPGGGEYPKCVGQAVSQSKQMKSTDSCVPPSSEKWLYLFYEHYERASVLSYSLYKIDIDLTTTTRVQTLDLSPILVFEQKQYPVQGMRCARLGSKLYFLGGKLVENELRDEFSREVYVFDMLTSSFKKMEASLNAGKPDPCVVFAANGKLYTLASIPSEAQVQLSGMQLFECFDPNTGKWQVLDNLPSLDMAKDGLTCCLVPKAIQWIGCTVLGKRKQVVLVGLEQSKYFEYSLVKCVYHYQQDKWTRHNLGKNPEVLHFHEGHGDYLYGLPSHVGPPVKSKSDCLSVLDDIALFPGNQAVDGLTYMSIPDKPTLDGRKWAEWVYTFFAQPYLDRTCRLLRYLGNDHFCYIAAGMLRSPDSPDRYGEEFSDLTTRGINVTLFKEKKNQGGENQLCFKAEILRFQDYHIKTLEDLNTAELLECFVVSPEKLQKKLDNRKKKKVQSFGSTSS